MKRILRFLITVALFQLASAPFAATVEARAPREDLEVILAIDASGSMRPAIEAAKRAAIEFVDVMPPGVRIGVEIFADVTTVLTPPTIDRDLIRQQINSIVLGSDTALYDVVVSASQHFTPTVTNKVLVLLSDGKDDGSLATLDQAIAASQGVQVEAISLTTSETDINSLLALGAVTSADDPAGVSAAFARVAGLVVEVAAPTTVPAPTAPPSTIAPTPAPAPATVPTVRPSAPAGNGTPVAVSVSSSLLWIGAAGLFVGLFLFGLLLFPRHRVSKVRLGIDQPRNVSELGMRTMSAVETVLERRGKRADLANTLAVADISMKPAEFVAIVVVVAIVVGLVGLAAAGPITGAILAMAFCLAVRFYLRYTKAKRQTAFADQVPAVLQLVTTALRSGFGITQALESVSEEAEEPARSEFAHVIVEARLGRDLSEALHALARRMESQDLEWVVSAIDINRDTGGNLSEVLSTVSATTRERARMAREVRTLTAEGRLSARILTAFPFIMAVWQWRVNPDNFELLLEGKGLLALIIAGLLMAIGTFWVSRVVKSVTL